MSNIENVKTIKTSLGDELITREVEVNNAGTHTCYSTMCIGMTPQAVPGIVPYILTSGDPIDHTVTLTAEEIRYIGQTDEPIAKEYLSMLGVDLEESVIIHNSDPQIIV